MIEDKIVL